jgi:hypothetical protein
MALIYNYINLIEIKFELNLEIEESKLKIAKTSIFD